MRAAAGFVDALIAMGAVPLASRAALIAAIDRRDLDWQQWMTDALRDQKRMTEETERQERQVTLEQAIREHDAHDCRNMNAYGLTDMDGGPFNYGRGR